MSWLEMIFVFVCGTIFGVLVDFFRRELSEASK